MSEIQGTLDREFTGTCACGERARYIHPDGNSCNKYRRCLSRDEALDRLADANKKVIKYETALTRLRDCDWVISLPDRMDAVREIAREALSNG